MKEDDNKEKLEQVIQYLKSAAITDKNPNATLLLATLYIKGTLIPEDPKKGVEYLQISARNCGDPKAKILLALAYFAGYVLSQNNDLGIALFREAVFRDKCPIAARYFEKYISSEAIITLSKPQIDTLFDEVSKSGNANLQFQWAELLKRKSSNKSDFKNIFELYRLASEKGHAKSHRALAEILFKRTG